MQADRAQPPPETESEAARCKVTALVLTCNVEDTVRGCLESVRWADEILVVDSFSADRTVEIAREFTDRVLDHEYVNYATQHNWAIPQASHPWVLIVDSDEQVTPELREEILRVLKEGPRRAGYRVYRENYFLGKPVRHCWRGDKCLRLFERDKARFPDRRVHANVEVDGDVGQLRGTLLHFTFRSFDQYMAQSFIPFTTRAAHDRAGSVRRVGVRHLVLHPLWRIFRQYILKRGFLDGRRGIVICGLSAFSAFMKYAKLWEMREREKMDRPK